MPGPMAVFTGMVVKLRKPHACGGDEWTVSRTGADVGLICSKCRRRVMLDRLEFERRVRQVVSSGDPAKAEASIDDSTAELT